MPSTHATYISIHRSTICVKGPGAWLGLLIGSCSAPFNPNILFGDEALLLLSPGLLSGNRQNNGSPRSSAGIGGGGGKKAPRRPGNRCGANGGGIRGRLRFRDMNDVLREAEGMKVTERSRVEEKQRADLPVRHPASCWL